jgi:hypothetical protein
MLSKDPKTHEMSSTGLLAQSLQNQDLAIVSFHSGANINGGLISSRIVAAVSIYDDNHSALSPMLGHPQIRARPLLDTFQLSSKCPPSCEDALGSGSLDDSGIAFIFGSMVRLVLTLESIKGTFLFTGARILHSDPGYPSRITHPAARLSVSC